MVSQIVEYFKEDNGNDTMSLMEFLLDKRDIIKQRKANKKQVKAFLDDMKCLYNESSNSLIKKQVIEFDIL